jgi:hypothetical protein
LFFEFSPGLGDAKAAAFELSSVEGAFGPGCGELGQERDVSESAASSGARAHHHTGGFELAERIEHGAEIARIRLGRKTTDV